jgi:hypothetical protein
MRSKIVMTRTEILLTMHDKPARSLFYTMQIGGSVAQLSKMEAEGLIQSQSRYGKGRQRDWYLSDDQHAALSFMFEPRSVSIDDIAVPDVSNRDLR